MLYFIIATYSSMSNRCRYSESEQRASEYNLASHLNHIGHFGERSFSGQLITSKCNDLEKTNSRRTNWLCRDISCKNMKSGDLNLKHCKLHSHFIFDYNSRISWSIFIIFVPLNRGMNTSQSY